VQEEKKDEWPDRSQSFSLEYIGPFRMNGDQLFKKFPRLWKASWNVPLRRFAPFLRKLFPFSLTQGSAFQVGDEFARV
jgi:hypothetical protein